MDDGMDFCLLCGKEVAKDKWREHMLHTHKMVLSKTPINDDGTWKDFDETELSN